MQGSALRGYGLQLGGGVAVVGRPGGPECVWFVSPQPQPGRVPAPLVLSCGAPAGVLAVTSFAVVVVSVVETRARVAIDSFAFASPAADLSFAMDDAWSANETVGAVPVRVAETEALVATDAFSSRVAAPAI